LGSLGPLGTWTDSNWYIPATIKWKSVSYIAKFPSMAIVNKNHPQMLGLWHGTFGLLHIIHYPHILFVKSC
jgi:lysophospholipid acyltransferase (LPLAT)-like uncharacterized protein